jgi:methionine-rich copper-binding protein CopC
MSARRVALALLVVLAGLLGGAGPVGAALIAHAQLVSTTPADGDTLETADTVTLTFSEDINAQFLQVRVEGPGGDETDGDPVADGRDVVQALAADLLPGEHRVTYRVVSVDGHPVSGTFAFTTTGPSAAASPTASASASAAATQRATPTASTDAASAPAETAPGWVVAALVGLIVLVVVGAATMLLRRRRDTGEEPPS